MPVERLTAPGLVFDACVALGVSLVSFLVLASFGSGTAPRGPIGTSRLVLAGALVALHTLPLAVRRRWPIAVLALNLGSGLAFVATALPTVTLGVASLVALYTVASLHVRRVSVSALAATELAALIATLPQQLDISTRVGNALILGVAWFLGTVIFERRSAIARLQQRTKELEDAREELARISVAEERLRIARELHDIVSHTISVIAVQSGVGAHLIDEDPAQAKRSLEAIESASKAALAELRHMLGILRRESNETTSRSPAPGLAQVPDLVESVGSNAGLEVRLTVDGSPTAVPLGTDLAAYRIVQEALTNVVRHSDSTRAWVDLTYGPQWVEIEVRDEGSAPIAESGSGMGLIGMRERAEAYGGSVSVGRAPEGGFRVSARLPTGGSR